MTLVLKPLYVVKYLCQTTIAVEKKKIGNESTNNEGETSTFSVFKPIYVTNRPKTNTTCYTPTVHQWTRFWSAKTRNVNLAKHQMIKCWQLWIRDSQVKQLKCRKATSQ